MLSFTLPLQPLVGHPGAVEQIFANLSTEDYTGSPGTASMFVDICTYFWYHTVNLLDFSGQKNCC